MDEGAVVSVITFLAEHWNELWLMVGIIAGLLTAQCFAQGMKW